MLSEIIGRDLIEDPGLQRTLLGDGIATFLAAFLGGPANTTYGENMSVVVMTRSIYLCNWSCCNNCNYICIFRSSNSTFNCNSTTSFRWYFNITLWIYLC